MAPFSVPGCSPPPLLARRNSYTGAAAAAELGTSAGVFRPPTLTKTMRSKSYNPQHFQQLLPQNFPQQQEQRQQQSQMPKQSFRRRSLYPRAMVDLQKDESCDINEELHRRMTWAPASPTKPFAPYQKRGAYSYSAEPPRRPSSFAEAAMAEYASRASAWEDTRQPSSTNGDESSGELTMLEALEKLEQCYESDDEHDDDKKMEQEPQHFARPQGIMGSQDNSFPLAAAAVAQAASHSAQRIEEQDAKLARALQDEEDALEAEIIRNREIQQKEERRQLAIALQQEPVPTRHQDKVIYYKAPPSIPGTNEEPDFSLVHLDCGEGDNEDEVCVICREPLCCGTAASLRVCQHIFHLDCIHDAIDHGTTRCPTCRQNVRREPQGSSPSGSLSVTRPKVKRHAYSSCFQDNRTIQLEYSIPDGVQMEYHDQPGKPYKGFHTFAYLPNTPRGSRLLDRFVYAFTHGLTFAIRTNPRTCRGATAWGSIPHRGTLAQIELEGDDYITSCNEILDQLGVPSEV